MQYPKRLSSVGLPGGLVLLIGLLLTACGTSSPTPVSVPLGAQPATSQAANTAATQPAPATPTIGIPATPTRRPTATPDVTPTTLVRAKLNQPVFSKDGIVVTAKNTELGRQFTKLIAANSGYTLLAIEIEIENKNATSYNVATQRFVIRDSTNTVYEYKIYGKFPALHDSKGYLGQNEKSAGWLTYEVPEIADGLLLEYKTGNELIQIEVE